MNGKACRLLFRPCETAAIYRIWKRADCGKKRSPARLLGDTGKWEKFEGQLGAQTMLLYRNFSCLNLWGEHACTTCYSQCLQKRGYSFSSTCSTFSHTFLLVFIASCRKHIRWSLRLSPVKIILLIWSFLFINCIFSYTQRDITRYFHNPTVFLTLTVYCTLRVSGEQFFFSFFLCSHKKNPNPIQTWAAVETSDSVTLDASTANTHRCRGCLKEKSNDGFTALVCHYISASVPKIPYATAVAMETVFGRIGEAQCKRTFCLCFELMDLLILWVTLCELA